MRLIRLRSHASLTCRLEIAKPNLGMPRPLALASTVRHVSEDLVACAKIGWKSRAESNRCERGNPNCGLGKRSDGQPLPAFGAACVQNQPATTGFHAGTKAMGANTFDFAGLIRSFHGET